MNIVIMIHSVMGRVLTLKISNIDKIQIFDTPLVLEFIFLFLFNKIHFGLFASFLAPFGNTNKKKMLLFT